MDCTDIILTVRKPDISTIPEHCMLQVILSDSLTAPLYLLYYSLQLISDCDVRKSLNMNFCYGDNRHLADHYPLIESFRVPDFLLDSEKKFTKFVNASLKEGYYLYFCVEVSEIRLYDKNPGISGIHDILLFGEKKSTYCVSDFFDGHYSFDECDKKQIIKGYFKRKKSAFPGIYLLKKTENDDFIFDASLVKTLLNEYVNGINSTTHYLPLKRSFYSGYSAYCFGINVYDCLKDYLLCHEPKEYSVRSFHILYEHKRVIQQLVQYLNSIGLLYNCEDLKKSAAAVVDKAFFVRTTVIKASVSGNDYRQKLCNCLDELKIMETDLMNRIICVLDKTEQTE